MPDVLAAHDAREAERLGVIGDHEHRFVEADVATVEQPQRLAGARATHDDAALELAQVVGVHRLAELEHHVVGDVDHGADRAQAGAAQPLAQPQRRLRLRAHAADDAAAKRAQPAPGASSTGKRSRRLRRHGAQRRARRAWCR